jgi:hypothetical protein
MDSFVEPISYNQRIGRVGAYTTEASFPVFGAGVDVAFFRMFLLAIAAGTTAILR